MSTVIFHALPIPELDLSEALRYAGCKEDEQMLALAHSCYDMLKKSIAPKVSYLTSPLLVKGCTCSFLDQSLQSHRLAEHLGKSKSILLMALTLGIGADRMLARFSAEPSRAVMLQAVATAMLEQVCDSFMEQYQAQHGVTLTSRFSPGYGDLPIDTQTVLFKLLDPKRIGLCLTDSLIMTPSKSVTAFAGINQGEHTPHCTNKCDGCTLSCQFRR